MLGYCTKKTNSHYFRKLTVLKHYNRIEINTKLIVCSAHWGGGIRNKHDLVIVTHCEHFTLLRAACNKPT